MTWRIFRLLNLLIFITIITTSCTGRNNPPVSSTQLPPAATNGIATSTPISINTPEPAQPPINQILDMQFIDAKQGWIIGASYAPDGSGRVVIRQTVDGGTTWTNISAPEVQFAPYVSVNQATANTVHQIRFADAQTGWIYGPSLLSTQDDGKEWSLVTLPGAIVAVEPAGSAQPTWAIVQNCPQIPDCTAQLYQAAPDHPQEWTPISVIPVLHPVLAFSRPDAQDGYLLVNKDTENLQVLLVATHDNGKSWSSESTGCISEQPLLATPDRLHLFVLCNDIPSAGNQQKAFYASTDAGATWSPIRIPTTGNGLGTYGYSDALLFITPKLGLLGLGRDTLYTTQDGGINWSSTGIDNAQDSSGWVLANAGGQDVYAAIQTTIYHSPDGGQTWQSNELH